MANVERDTQRCSAVARPTRTQCWLKCESSELEAIKDRKSPPRTKKNIAKTFLDPDPGL